MNRDAIIHLSNLEDTYALTETEAIIRIRTAQDDLQAISECSSPSNLRVTQLTSLV